MTRKAVNNWYPSKADFPDEAQFNVVRQLTDMIYDLQSKQSNLKSSVEDHAKNIKKLKEADPGGPSTTKIAGLFVKGVQPKDGQVLTYKAASGQIEFT